MSGTMAAGAWRGPARRARATSAEAGRAVSRAERAAWPSVASLCGETLSVLGARAGPPLACAAVLAGVDAVGALVFAMDGPEKLTVLVFRLAAGVLVLPFACGAVAWIGMHRLQGRRVAWGRVWRALAGRRHALAASWLCCAILTGGAMAGARLVLRDRAQAADPAGDARWPLGMFSGLSHGDAFRSAFERALRGSAPATSMGSAEWLAALWPDRPLGLDEVCRTYQLNMAPLQSPNHERSLGLDCATAPARETAPSTVPMAMLAVLAGAWWPFCAAVVLSPGASRRLTGMMRCLPLMLAHAGLLGLAAFAATWLFIALPAAVAPAARAVFLPHPAWAAPAIELLTAIGGAAASSLLAVFGLVYAARLLVAAAATSRKRR
jgi:hypothetical protein